MQSSTATANQTKTICTVFSY